MRRTITKNAAALAAVILAGGCATATLATDSMGGNAAGDAADETAAKVRTQAIDCSEAYTTLAMNECLAKSLAQANERRTQYLAAAIERYGDRPALSQMINASDVAFQAYRQAECSAVYDDWKEGSIRGIMSLTCRIAMTDARTHTIWQNWLTYPDSTPPILPAPKRTP